jgi:hypothetical protein
MANQRGGQRSIYFAFTVATLVMSLGLPASAQPADRVGDTYEISLELVSDTSSAMSSGSSRDRYVLIERVIALREDGIELEFDLPKEIPEEDRVKAWQYPARVLLSPGRPLKLLNAADAETRLAAWLGDKAKALCGHWVLTWTAVKVDCDPQSIVQGVEPFIVKPVHPAEGAPYEAVGAKSAAPLRIEQQSAGGSVFVADLVLDPETVRRQRAQTDVAVAEMMGQALLTLEAAIEAHAQEKISGTISVRIETDAQDRVVRRTTVTRSEVVVAGAIERQKSTETVAWRLVTKLP